MNYIEPMPPTSNVATPFFFRTSSVSRATRLASVSLALLLETRLMVPWCHGLELRSCKAQVS